MKLLYQDEEIAVVCKDPGELSQKDLKNRTNLPTLLEEALGGTVYPVHRLDRETGGVMVFARTGKAAAALSLALQEHRFQKSYLAIVKGKPEPEGEFRDLLFFDRKKNKVFPVRRERKGVKSALLRYRVLKEGEDDSLVEVEPVTGRTHQIRVQFASRKMPLYGDAKYGGTGFSLGLFCHSLSFPHPNSGAILTFTEEPPHREPWILFKL